MTTQEFLNQAYRLDQRINSKIDQLASLNDLALKATVTYSGMPHSHNKGSQAMANTVDRIIDLQNEINREIDELVDLKTVIRSVIYAVSETDLRLLLEERYLNWKTWDQIAALLGYNVRYVHKLHVQALHAVRDLINLSLDNQGVSNTESRGAPLLESL